MLRLRLAFWSLMALLLTVAAGLGIVKFNATRTQIQAVRVPPGDQEIAWFHTATSTGTWERFVTGVQHFGAKTPGWEVDDSRAYPDRSTDVPEVTVRRAGSAHFLRIRWYKQSSQAKVVDWVKALSERSPPPLAVMGGGSTDRALELAETLQANTDRWKGPNPLLLITTATANSYHSSRNEYAIEDLLGVYPGRSFRFCFTNRQMAEAVLDFVWWKKDELRPYRSPPAALGMLVGGAAAYWLSDTRPTITAIQWDDDPYSVDLVEQFRWALDEHDLPPEKAPPWKRLGCPQPLLQKVDVASSIGGYSRANRWEAKVADELLSESPPLPLQRSLPRNGDERVLLILPTVPQPARRMLATLTGALPNLGRQLVAVNGDGIAFNNVYRDRDLVWNVRRAPVPLVFFTHQNPVAWDAESPLARPDQSKFALYGPNGTDDVLHFSDMVRILAEAAYDVEPSHSPADELIPSADELRERLMSRQPAFFEPDGNRRGGSGEYVVYLRPGPRGEHTSATLEVWTRSAGVWVHVPPRLELNY